MALYQSHFHNAHDFEIHGGQFINVAPGATLTINKDATDAVSTILRQYVATGATFDSAERYPPGKCHPGTRKRIIKEIMDWIDDPDNVQYIVWLYGPAGSGKSALAQSICEHLLQTCPQTHGASFFFANGDTDRGNALRLFATISYQLAVHFPSVRSEINKALDRDPTLPTKSMEIQLQCLIIQPLLQSKGFPSHRPVIAIIDGLDECADDELASTQRNIVALIAKAVVDHKLPLRFLIASRPEYWIRDAFDMAPLPRITLSLSLWHAFDIDEDIRTYLADEFERIRVDNKRVMGSVALPWPPTEVVGRLVYEASGQFIYASTVIRFVGKSSRFSDPQEQLRFIISPGPQRAVAFSELDRLYARILSAYPRWETMKRVLGGLMVYDGNLTVVKIFLDVDPNELVLVLDSLSSLIEIKKTRSADEMFHQLLKLTCSKSTPQDTVFFYHLSFLEFLKDRTRSRAFYIDVDGFRDEVTRAFFGIIHRSLDQDYGNDRCSTLNIDFATYHWIMYKVAIESLQASTIDTLQSLMAGITGRLLCLVEFYFGTSMECLVRFAEDMGVLKSAIEANLWTSGHWMSRGDLKQLADFRTLHKKFRDAVFQSHKRAMDAVMLGRELKVTPVLVYLAEFHGATEHLSPQTLSTLSATRDLDIIATIEKNRQIMYLFYSHLTRTWCLRVVDFRGFLANSGIQDSDEWKNQRAFLAFHLLESVFEETDRSLIGGINNAHDRCSILGKHFFDSRSMTDVCGRRNHRNACKCLSLLQFISALHSERTPRFWSWEPAHRHVISFLISMICWLNRQLTNPQNLKLLQDHDEAVPHKLTATMKHLFQHLFLSQSFESHAKKIYATLDPCDPLNYKVLSVTIVKVLPLPQGFYAADGIDFIRQEDRSEYLDWHTFHDEVFGRMDGSTENSKSYMIDPSLWHPHFASRLLRSLFRFLFCQVNPVFSISDPWDEQARLKFQKSLSYIPQCLPFVEPTLENLEALRLIVYLYPRVIDASTVTFLLPEGTWLLLAAFLQKYPRNLLSSEELALFESWLYSPDHSDIKEYVHQ